jgi:hypothetical protein
MTLPIFAPKTMTIARCKVNNFGMHQRHEQQNNRQVMNETTMSATAPTRTDKNGSAQEAQE